MFTLVASQNPSVDQSVVVGTLHIQLPKSVALPVDTKGGVVICPASGPGRLFTTYSYLAVFFVLWFIMSTSRILFMLDFYVHIPKRIALQFTGELPEDQYIPQDEHVSLCIREFTL